MKLDLEILEAIYTNKGNDLHSLTEQSCVMLVFLRHFGCTFCREALDDFSKIKQALEGKNIKLVFVHMAEEQIGQDYLNDYGLNDEEHISDPDMSLYEYFGLQKGGLRELYGLKIWTRAFRLSYGLDTGNPHLGNMKQMPGVFVIKNGEVLNSFIHKSAADKPDYLEIAEGAFTNNSNTSKAE